MRAISLKCFSSKRGLDAEVRQDRENVLLKPILSAVYAASGSQEWNFHVNFPSFFRREKIIYSGVVCLI